MIKNNLDIDIDGDIKMDAELSEFEPDSLQTTLTTISENMGIDTQFCVTDLENTNLQMNNINSIKKYTTSIDLNSENVKSKMSMLIKKVSLRPKTKDITELMAKHTLLGIILVCCSSLFYMMEFYFYNIALYATDEIDYVVSYSIREFEITISVICVYLGFAFNKQPYYKICFACHNCLFGLCYNKTKKHIFLETVSSMSNNNDLDSAHLDL